MLDRFGRPHPGQYQETFSILVLFIQEYILLDILCETMCYMSRSMWLFGWMLQVYCMYHKGI